MVLAKWLLQNKARIRNQNCLDLGCGLGVSTCAAALCGAKITAVDNTWEALCYARYNLKVNGLRNVNWVYMDWNHPAFLPGCFDFILGSDVPYESGFFKPLLYLFGLALAPQGRIWLASPDRSVTRSFWEILKKYHWKTGLLQKTIPKQAQNNNTTIYFSKTRFRWELKA